MSGYAFLRRMYFVEAVLDGFVGWLRFVFVGVEFGLVLGADLEGIHDACERGFEADADEGILVEEVVDPWDLTDWGEVVEALGGVGDEVIDGFFLVDEAVMSAEADVSGDVPGDCGGVSI
jgi:hypothetical protein